MNKIKYFGKVYEVPSSATHIAMDGDGSIYAYNSEPYRSRSMWRGEGSYHIAGYTASTHHWWETLKEIQDLIIPTKPRKPKVGKVAPHLSNEVRLVLAGTKPLASIEKYKDQYGYALAVSLAQSGALYMEVVSECEVVITLPKSRMLVEQWRWLLNNGVKTYGLHEFHKQMGLLYGYTEEDINTFIKSNIECKCNKCVGNKTS